MSTFCLTCFFSILLILLSQLCVLSIDLETGGALVTKDVPPVKVSPVFGRILRSHDNSWYFIEVPFKHLQRLHPTTALAARCYASRISQRGSGWSDLPSQGPQPSQEMEPCFASFPQAAFLTRT